MDEFKVQVTSAARKDLNDISCYISETLLEPSIANKLYDEIKNGIFSLKTMPSRFPVIDEKPFSLLRIRKLCVKNYIIFYSVDDNQKIVTVFRILYGRRHIENLL